METAVRNFLVDVPQAAVIWLTLLVVAVMALALLSHPGSRRRPGHRTGIAGAGSGDPTFGGRDEAARYAGEVAVAADRAVTTARRRRADWLAAQDRVEVAWRAFDDADAAVRRLAGASAFPVPRTPRTPAEFAERERYLHRAATAACRRQQLPVAVLSDALAHRNGWDPRRHPLHQEAVLAAVVREHLLRRYLRATAEERTAWHHCEVAAAAARSLQDEAFAAAALVPVTTPHVPAERDRPVRAARSARRPRLAVR